MSYKLIKKITFIVNNKLFRSLFVRITPERGETEQMISKIKVFNLDLKPLCFRLRMDGTFDL